MTAADMAVKVDATIRPHAIDGIAAKLTEFYVYPDTAKKTIDALRAHSPTCPARSSPASLSSY